MYNQLATNANTSPVHLLTQPRATADSEGATQPPLAAPSYTPYAEKPALPEPPYKPYAEEPDPHEPPYEPYKGL